MTPHDETRMDQMRRQDELIYNQGLMNGMMFGADPLFADSLKGDYRLAPDSPLIEKGRGNSCIGA
jgi:hypothetical protein